MIGLTYKDAGVDYDHVDAFKRYAQSCAYQTKGNTARHGVADVTESRGESVHLLELPDRYLAFVDEGLGTKSVIARRVAWRERSALWRGLAQDTVAMAVNDMITLGAQPLNASMHLQVAESEWFGCRERWQELCTGWYAACNDAGCVRGPGETPVLRDVIVPGECSLSAACVGQIHPKSRRIMGDVQPGDRIVLLGSSGMHANGLTLARRIADRLPDGYQTPVPGSDVPFGELLLTPTTIYARFVEACLEKGVRIRYLVNITGHGWRKLMRLETNMRYVIEKLAPELPVFAFIQAKGTVSTSEMYQTFNMGAGFAVYVHPDDVPSVLELASRHRHTAIDAGFIEPGEKSVFIEPLGITYTAESLRVR